MRYGDFTEEDEIEFSEDDLDFDQEREEEQSKKRLRSSIIEAVENQLRDNNPPFVAEIFSSLQRKGCCRRQARTVIASVLLEEIYDVARGTREYDEKKYEKALRKRNRTVRDVYMLPYGTIHADDEINDACEAVLDAIDAEREEEAAELFLDLWPTLKEYVVYNLYRETASGIEKPELEDIPEMTEYEVNFDSLLSEVGTMLQNTRRYQETIDFSKEMLELFSWKVSSPAPYKNDIGFALAEMGNEHESEAWFQKLLAEEPDNIEYISGYVFSLQIRGDSERALKVLEAHLPADESEDIRFEGMYTQAARLYGLAGDTERADHFENLLKKIQEQISAMAEKFEEYLEEDWEQDLPAKKVHKDFPGESRKEIPIVKEKKIYPNDPCPCGSGKKYKKCCGR